MFSDLCLSNKINHTFCLVCLHVHETDAEKNKFEHLLLRMARKTMVVS